MEIANVSTLLELCLNSGANRSDGVRPSEAPVLSNNGFILCLFVCLFAGGRRRDRGHDEKWDQTGKEMAQCHLTHNDAQNFQDGAEGSG